ncbi:hypothetical protein DL98DRAFT_569064 [Cadophora sp. DSE1049]|nr:hypothetical protein DL98DRAFT_569064 [Cadophora sp. DSE1049]
MTDSAQSNLYAFLQKIPRLQSLRTDGHGVTYTLLSEDLSVRQTLLDLTLHVGDMTATMVLQLASLPRLRCLSIEGLKGPELSKTTLESIKKIELRRLDLRGSQVGHRVLQEILGRSYALDKLYCNVPLQTDFPRDTFGGGILHIPYSLSPSRIGTCFTSTAHTLTKLDLGTQHLHWQGHDGSRLDLSSFVKLKVLSIAALCILAPLPLRISRDGLYKLLPYSLERLVVKFCFNIGIFYSTVYGVGQVEEQGLNQFLLEDMDKSSYRWILELATFKDISFPRLESVCLYEEVSERYAMFASEEWDPPLTIDHSFDEADIELDVSVRLPKR